MGVGKKAVDYEKEKLLLLRKLCCDCGKMEKGSRVNQRKNSALNQEIKRVAKSITYWAHCTREI